MDCQEVKRHNVCALFRFLVKQRCGSEEGAGSSSAECASAWQLCRHHLSRWSEALLCLWISRAPETLKEMHVLHLQRQGVCVLLSSGHYLDQHTRVRVTLQKPYLPHFLLLLDLYIAFSRPYVQTHWGSTHYYTCVVTFFVIRCSIK